MKGRQLDLEQAIRETTDRRAKHERGQREAGRHKFTTWIADEDRELFAQLAELSRGGWLRSNALLREVCELRANLRLASDRNLRAKRLSP